MKGYLYKTVSEGTGKSAKVPGYSMGGKTGTAQKGNRDDKKYVVSFIGFAPVEEPQVLVYVVIDDANVPLEQQSSALATEMAKQIFTEILPYLNIFQDEELPEDTSKGQDAQEGRSQEGSEAGNEGDEAQGTGEPEYPSEGAPSVMPDGGDGTTQDPEPLGDDVVPEPEELN